MDWGAYGLQKQYKIQMTNSANLTMLSKNRLSDFIHALLKLLVMRRLLLTLIFATSWCLADEDYPIASQYGPSCAFFANVPALTYASGVHIGNASGFIRPIYALHHGDDEFDRAFSKEKFYELFAIPHESHEIRHEDLPVATLLGSLEKLIEEKFDPELAKGNAFSLRVIGVFGGPHNALLMEKVGDKYLAHDPFPGKLKWLSLTELAEWMLVPTSATRKLEKKRFFTNYLEISLPHRHKAPWKPMNQLPATLKVEWRDDEREILRKALTAKMAGEDNLNGRVERYPGIDFAALPPKMKGKPLRNTMNEELGVEKLQGVLHLAKFTLSVWHLGNRDRVPVLFMKGHPYALVSYRPAEGTDANEATLIFYDGNETIKISPNEALLEFKKDGMCYGTIVIPCRKK
jgi:hypothetical protein